LYKRTKFPSNIVFTSQCEKVAYFYDVGSTYAIDQKINHLHNDRVANMWRNNVSSVCGRGLTGLQGEKGDSGLMGHLGRKGQKGE
jgi:hypothetical protein